QGHQGDEGGAAARRAALCRGRRQPGQFRRVFRRRMRRLRARHLYLQAGHVGRRRRPTGQSRRHRLRRGKIAMNLKAELFCDSRCELGEGPFWHPLLDRLFWFDILNQTLLSADENGHLVDRFAFKDVVSAAGVIDRDHLLIAQAGMLLRFQLSTGSSVPLAPIEADKPGNRTNDGRVNRAGGFWIGTMSRNGGEHPGAGALYQYREGPLSTILDNVTIPNSTCFSPDGRTAYFADTMTDMIRKV